jgi:hypothetical protein
MGTVLSSLVWPRMNRTARKFLVRRQVSAAFVHRLGNTQSKRKRPLATPCGVASRMISLVVASDAAADRRDRGRAWSAAA